MKKLYILIFTMILTGAVFGQTEKQKVAVYVTGSDENVNKVLASKLALAIVNNGKYSAVERNDAIIAMLRKEQVYQRSGSVDDKQIGKLGKELGVDFICIAEITEVFGEKYISARLVDANLAEAVAMADVNGDISNMTSLVKMSETVANKLMNGKSGSNSGSTTTTTTTSTNTDNPTDPKAQYELGNKYSKSKDYVEAVKWYRKSAEQGYAEEQNELGNIYRYGCEGVTRNDYEAVKWWRKSAEQGNAEGQYYLGKMYGLSVGGLTKDKNTPDYYETVKWYRKAAEQGHIEAQHDLGFHYQHGIGVTENKEQAIYWYKKAAKQGNTSAIEALQNFGITNY